MGPDSSEREDLDDSSGTLEDSEDCSLEELSSEKLLEDSLEELGAELSGLALLIEEASDEEADEETEESVEEEDPEDFHTEEEELDEQ